MFEITAMVEWSVRLQVFIFRDRLEMLQRKTASQYEYLKIKDTVGNVTHIPGYGYPLVQQRGKLLGY